MTEMIRRLAGDGLVERRADPVDGRAAVIYLDRLVRARLGAERLRELKAALRGLTERG